MAPSSRDWVTCSSCGKKSWLTRRAAKAALKWYYPGEFQYMQVYKCHSGGTGYHHGHRIPERFRNSNLTSCRNCQRQIRREAPDLWIHVDTGLVMCGRSGDDSEATPFWQDGWM